MSTIWEIAITAYVCSLNKLYSRCRCQHHGNNQRLPLRDTVSRPEYLVQVGREDEMVFRQHDGVSRLTTRHSRTSGGKDHGRGTWIVLKLGFTEYEYLALRFKRQS